MVAYVLVGLFALLIFLSISDVVIAVADWSPKKALKPKGGTIFTKKPNRVPHLRLGAHFAVHCANPRGSRAKPSDGGEIQNGLLAIRRC